jgi:hypothetical protein
VRRREDGYHDLASLFHVIGIALGGGPLYAELAPCGFLNPRHGHHLSAFLFLIFSESLYLSAFHGTDLGDDMAFEELAGTASSDVLSCDMEGVPNDESNLVIKVGSSWTVG